MPWRLMKELKRVSQRVQLIMECLSLCRELATLSSIPEALYEL